MNTFNSPTDQNSESGDIQILWLQALTIIKGRVNSQSYKTWFEPIVPRALDGNRFIIQVPSQFFCEWLEEHYYSLINEALTKAKESELTLDYVIASEDREATSGSSVATPIPPGLSTDPRIGSELGITLEPSLQTSLRAAPASAIVPSLITRYTFENYIKGESNQFARAAALAVANNPGGTSFNPLVIYGGVGLGKTHLVHSIGNHLNRANHAKRVLYISSEKFTVDFVESIQKDNVAEFSHFYRSVDLLI